MNAIPETYYLVSTFFVAVTRSIPLVGGHDVLDLLISKLTDP